ncbi:esterase/lipase family protein [Actinoplanes sp. NPDC000266]
MSTLKPVPAQHQESVEPTLDVVFVHGLDGDPKTTWTNSEGEEFYWPEKLADDLLAARVWAFGYDAPIRKESMNPLDRANNLLAEMAAKGVGVRPWVGIGHSLGGLLLKKSIVNAHLRAPRYEHIAANLAGLVFLGTPHKGSGMASLAVRFADGTGVGETIRFLQADGYVLRELEDDYNGWAIQSGVEHRVFFETQKIYLQGKKRKWRKIALPVLVVPEASADPGLPGVLPIPVDEDHMSIAKPGTRDHLVYQETLGFLKQWSGSPSPVPVQRQAESPSDREIERAAYRQRQRRVFAGSGWAKTLRALYPHYPLLRYANLERPIWVLPSHQDQMGDLESVLGGHAPDAGETGYAQTFDPEGRRSYEKRKTQAETTGSFDGATFALDRITFENGKATVYAKHGTYFQSLDTSEVCERELVDALDMDPEREVELSKLPRRKFLHEVARGDQVLLDGRRRAAALSISATIVVPNDNGYYAFVARRSAEVETHPDFFHVAPAGIFAPMNGERRDVPSEYSVLTSILREYGEELFAYQDLEQGDGRLATDPEALPPIRELLAAKRRGDVRILYSGISIPLFTLRPEICVAVLVKRGDWFEQEIERSKSTDHRFQLNWEYEPGQESDSMKLAFDKDFQPVEPAKVDTSRIVPHAAAALHLAGIVVRRERDEERSGAPAHSA